MSVLDCMIFDTYDEVNDYFGLEAPSEKLSNDRNVEDPACIVYVRKWTWDDMPAEGPNLGFLGLELKEHIELGAKADLFIFSRG